jgi:hypothetical protein
LFSCIYFARIWKTASRTLTVFPKPDASSFYEESDQPHTVFSLVAGRFPYSVRRRKEI